MNLKHLLLLLITLISSKFISQETTVDFKINTPETKVINSEFKSIKLIDARPDTTNVGIIQKGAFNNKTLVIPKIPLRDQFQNIFTNQNKNSNANRELVLYLKQLYLAEVTGVISEKGYFYLQAFLFSKVNNDEYIYLNKIDTIIVHSSIDVTKAIMRKGSDLAALFIYKNVYDNRKNGEVFSYNQIKNYDKLIKSQYKLYRSENLVDGLYKDFESFRNQTPTDEKLIKIKTIPSGEKAFKLYTINKNGKEKEIQNKSDYYAIVYKGIPYIHSDLEYAFNKMTQNPNSLDYHFKARIKSTAKTEDIITAAFFFGMVGAIIASNSNAVFDMKLDYINGSFIPLKEVNKK